MQRACTILWLGLLSMGLCSTVSIRTTCAEVPEFLVRKNAQWKYFAQRAEPPEDWNQAAFDDAEWKSGVAGFGYGDGDDRTVLDKMRGRYTSVYIRTTFEIDKTVGMESLYLYLNFDDGFIAYLNGKQVAAAAVKRAADTLRVELHEAQGYEQFVIKDAARTLVPGKNVLAIEGHNAAVESSDFSLDPFLMKQRLESLDMLLGVEDYLADLDEFEVRLLDQSSYLTRRGFDVTTAAVRMRYYAGYTVSLYQTTRNRTLRILPRIV